MKELYVILATILIFLIMVSLHEFGHFIFGKMLGFEVPEYAIGFGPAIWKKQGKKTLYSFRIIPFGGFCRFLGEDEETKDVKGAFNEQKAWKRFVVISAGAIFNIILGFIIFLFVVGAKDYVATNTVESLVEGTQIAESGIMSGDKIIKINGNNITFKQDIDLFTQTIQKNEKIDITVLRNNEKLTFKVIPTKYEEQVLYGKDGIDYTLTIGTKTEKQVIEYSDLNTYDADKIGRTSNNSGYMLGIHPKIEKITALNIVPYGFKNTCFMVKLVYKSLIDLITGRAGLDQLSGPIGIVSQVNNDVDAGYVDWNYILNLVALLTINLGVMNLLPLPALDGGRLLFVIFEMIFKKPVPRDKEGVIHMIGFVILFALMIFVMFHDIWKIFVQV